MKQEVKEVKFNPFLGSIELEDKINSTAEVRGITKSNDLIIAKCTVLDGKINLNSKIRVVRDGIVIYNGKIRSFICINQEAVSGQEFEIIIENFNNIKVGDIIETF